MSEVITPKRYNTKQAAAYLGVAEQTLHNRRFKRLAPDYIKIGRKILYDVRDLDRFLNENRVCLSA